MKSAESTKASYDKEVEKSHKNTVDHPRAATINIWKNLGKTQLNTLKCGRVTTHHSVALLLS